MAADQHTAIVSLLNLYGVAVDTRKWELLDDIFAPDARISYFGMKWGDLSSFRSDFAAAHAPLTATQHFIGNPMVRVEGRRAAALSSCLWTLVRVGTPGGDRYSGGAWYDDVLTHTPSGWRVTERTCGLLWTEGNPAVSGADRAPACEPLHLAVAAGRLQAMAHAWSSACE